MHYTTYKEKANQKHTLNPTKYDIKEFFLENLGFKVFEEQKNLHTLYHIKMQQKN